MINYDPKYHGEIASLAPVVLPGDEGRVRKNTPEIELSPRIAFRDNGGWNWNRDLLGLLHEGGGPINEAMRVVPSREANPKVDIADRRSVTILRAAAELCRTHVLDMWHGSPLSSLHQLYVH